MIIDFTERHRAKAIEEIVARLNTDWDGLGNTHNDSWNKAVHRHAAEVYEAHMARRSQARS